MLTCHVSLPNRRYQQLPSHIDTSPVQLSLSHAPDTLSSSHPYSLPVQQQLATPPTLELLRAVLPLTRHVVLQVILPDRKCQQLVRRLLRRHLPGVVRCRLGEHGVPQAVAADQQACATRGEGDLADLHGEWHRGQQGAARSLWVGGQTAAGAAGSSRELVGGWVGGWAWRGQGGQGGAGWE